jgi:prevent-host-death family protein
MVNPPEPATFRPAKRDKSVTVLQNSAPFPHTGHVTTSRFGLDGRGHPVHHGSDGSHVHLHGQTSLRRTRDFFSDSTGVRRTMSRLNVVELRQTLADVLNRAEYRGEWTIIHRRGKDVAAIVSIPDLRLLERAIAELEDRIDIEESKAALAESDERIPFSEVRRSLGLTDEPTKKPRGRKTKQTIHP